MEPVSFYTTPNLHRLPTLSSAGLQMERSHRSSFIMLDQCPQDGERLGAFPTCGSVSSYCHSAFFPQYPREVGQRARHRVEPRRHFLASWKPGSRITERSMETSSRENRERWRAGHFSSPSGLGEARGKGTWGLGWEPSTFGRKHCSSRNRLKMQIVSEGRPIPVCSVHSRCILCNICFKITVPSINRNILMH